MLKTFEQQSFDKIIDNLIVLYNQKDFSEVIKKTKTLINEYPDNEQLFSIMGITLLSLKEYRKALNYFKESIKINPNNSNSFFNVGLTYYNLRDLKNAVINYKKALKIEDKHLDALFNLAITFTENKNPKQAIKYYQKAIEIDYDNVFVHFNLGNIYYEQSDFLLAIKHFKSAINIDPNYPNTYYNLAAAFERIKDYPSCLKYYKLSFHQNSQEIKALTKIRLLFKKMRKNNEAIRYFKNLLKTNPNSKDILYNLAVIFKNNGELVKAKFYFNKLLKIDDKDINSYLLLGEVLCDTLSLNQGLKLFKKAIAIDENYHSSHSFLLFNVNYCPNHTSEEIFSYYQQFNDKFGLPLQKEWQPFTPVKKPKKKLKIGYVSPDFRNHSMKGFLKPVLANHNHEYFEIFAFAELSKEDHVTKQYQSYVDHWIPTQSLTDEQMVQKIRDMEIDILVDLAGHTNGNRLGVFARKPAPVSLSWWIGYGYTTGLSSIDYFLANKVLAPEGNENLFSEKICHLPHHAAIWDPDSNQMGDVGPLPALKNGHITFGTLTRAIRINDHVIKAWADILKRVKNSKLIINSEDFINYKTRRILVSKFNELNIDRNRLEIGFHSPPWDTMRQIDIALDCFPHNSGTTLIEHLYMGNPFVTYANRPSVGRIGASILTALGREEWIANSEQEYVDKVTALASNVGKLTTIRSSLRKEMETSPIMDHKGFVGELEKTYQSMWGNWYTN